MTVFLFSARDIRSVFFLLPQISLKALSGLDIASSSQEEEENLNTLRLHVNYVNRTYINPKTVRLPFP